MNSRNCPAFSADLAKAVCDPLLLLFVENGLSLVRLMFVSTVQKDTH